MLTSVLVTSSSQSVSENLTTHNDILTSSAVCSVASLISSGITTCHINNHINCPVELMLDQYRNHLSDKPTFIQLVEHVIPLYASQWKT